MRLRYWFLLIVIPLAVILSCKSVPLSSLEPEPVVSEPSPEIVRPEAVPEVIPADEKPSLAALPEEPADEAPSVAALPGEPAEVDILVDLSEPVVDLAEVDSAEIPPVEEPLLVVLPEPAVPVLPSPEPKPQAAPLAAEPVPETIAQAAPVPPAAAQPVTPPTPLPVAPPAVPPPSPAPPAAVTPSLPPAEPNPEEEIPPPIVREPVPLPVRPVPEPPAAIPPVVRKEEGIVFSRIVRATVGQLVEIPFRGTGWVYLGELGSRRGISYDSRRLESEGQSFVFRAEAAGTYALKFYKEDFVRDYILNDHVQVIIGEAPAISLTGYFNPVLDRGRVVAEPRWPTVAEEAEAFRRDGDSPAAAPAPAAIPLPAIPAAEGQPSQAEGGQAAEPVSALPPTPSAQDTAPLQKLEADQYLTRAREEFDAGRVAAAIGFLDQFREQYPSGSDEAYWLYGQFYEANSPSRDIRLSLDYYRRLVREYPQSSRYNDARRRIAYLERYYINIR